MDKMPGITYAQSCMQVGQKWVHAGQKLNSRTTKAALSPKAWVCYAMDTVPLIMNAQG